MKYKLLVIILVLALFSISCSRQTTMNIKRNVINGELNKVTYYTGYKYEAETNTVVLVVSGSSRISIVEEFVNGVYFLNSELNIIYPERTYFEDSKLYYEYENRDQKFHDLVTVIEHLIDSGVTEIILLADSEGTMIAPELAKIYKDYVSALICYSGSVIPLRDGLKYYAKNELKFNPSFNLVDLNNALKQIDHNPESRDNKFLKLSYKFWSSYLDYRPIDDLKELNCSVLYINGENDKLNIEKQLGIIEQLKEGGLDIEQIVYKKAGKDLSELKQRTFKDTAKWGERKNIFNRE